MFRGIVYWQKIEVCVKSWQLVVLFSTHHIIMRLIIFIYLKAPQFSKPFFPTVFPLPQRPHKQFIEHMA